MENYTPADNFSAVQTYETTDPVLGGTGGESNVPVKALADRTEYLKNRVGGFRDVTNFTASGTVTAAHANNLITVKATANVTLTVDDVNTFKPGQKLTIKAKLSGAGGPFWLNVITANDIENGSVIRTNIWLYDGESIELTAEAANWNWTDAKGNFDRIGEDDFKRIQPRNTLVADGTLGDLRAKYPRLWEVVEAEAISDAAWTGTPYRYRGLFSTGNATTTFRRRDLRSMSIRGLDLSRGVSAGRMDEFPGGCELDAVGPHKHPVNRTTTNGAGTIYEANSLRQGGDRGLWWGGNETTGLENTGEGSAPETKVKNIGLIPVIYY